MSGLEAAWVAASRGYQVTLYEESDKLGGQWYLAAMPPHKEGFLHFLEWLKKREIKEVAASGLVIETAEGESVLPGTTDIVFAVGSRSKNSLESALKGVVNEVHVIGDAAKPRYALVAVREGWEIGCEV